MRYAVLVTTAPRHGPTLVGRCVASLVRAGFTVPEITIFAEPGSAIGEIAVDASRVIVWSERQGVWRNWIAAVRQCLAEQPELDRLVTVQDDVVFCRRLRAFLEREAWPGSRCGARHVYTSGRYKRYRRGLQRLEANQDSYQMAGACAIEFSRQAIADILGYASRHPWRGSPRKSVKDPAQQDGLDVFIGEALTALGYQIWIRRPSLAEHDSPHSSLGHGPARGPRRGLDFIGEDGNPFDHFPVRPA